MVFDKNWKTPAPLVRHLQTLCCIAISHTDLDTLDEGHHLMCQRLNRSNRCVKLIGTCSIVCNVRLMALTFDDLSLRDSM